MSNKVIFGAVAILGLVVAAFLGQWALEGPVGEVGVGQDGLAEKSGLEAPAKTTLPNFDVVRVERDGSAVVAGRSRANAVVTLLDGEQTLGRTQADSRGQWVVIPEAAFQPGTRELSLRTTVPGGDSRESDSVVVITVPERKNGGAAETLAVLVPRGGGPSRVLQKPGPRAVAEGLSIDIVDHDDNGNISLTGTAEPGAEIRAYLDNDYLGRAFADDQGAWSLRPLETVGEETYVLRLDRIGSDGNVAARVELPLSLDLFGVQDFSTGQVVVRPGNSLWRIARRIYGRGIKYSIIYRANKDQIRDPDLIYPDQVLSVPKDHGP